MFLDLSAEQKIRLKKARFPEERDFYIRNSIFSTSGTDTIGKIFLELSETTGSGNASIGNRKFKIFQNKDNKDIKLKIFEITDSNMKQEVQRARNIFELDDIINRYGTVFIDLSAASAFIGDKKDINKHIVTDLRNGYKNLLLTFPIKFVFPDKDVKFLSIGAVFYYDILDFVEKTKTPIEFLETENLLSDIKIFDIFDEAGKNLNPSFVSDSRQINKIFASSATFEKINEKLNIEYPITKKLSSKQKKPLDTSYFSNPYISRDQSGNIKLIFSIDFRKIIQNNSVLESVFSAGQFREEILVNYCKLSSIKILRRECNTNDRTKIKTKKNGTEKCLAISGDRIENSILVPFSDSNYSLEEIGIFKNFRNFLFLDKEAFASTSNYEYGIEISILDSSINYIKQIRDDLLAGLPIIKEYLLETQKIAKTQEKINLGVVTGVTVEGSYDPIGDCFTKDFVLNGFSKFDQGLEKSVYLFINVLKLFGVINQENKSLVEVNSRELNLERGLKEQKLLSEEEEIKNTISSMISPTGANERTIRFFLNSYSRLILQLEKIIKNNYNNVLTFEKWFGKESLISTEIPYNIGYQFFNKQNLNGFINLNQKDIEEKLADQVKLFASNLTIPAESEELKYGYVAPSFIRTSEQVISSSVFSTYDDVDFANAEMAIKQFNLSDDKEIKVVSSEPQSTDPLNLNFLKKKTASFSNNFDFNIANLNKKILDNSFIKRNENSSVTQIDKDIDPSYLLLSMLKGVTEKNKLISQKSLYSKIVNVTKKSTPQEPLPFQIVNLNNDLTNIITKKSDYLKDLDENSKFLLFFNTIHSIEVLEYNNNNLNDEKWKLLTKEFYNKMEFDKTFLCRLNLFQKNNLNISSFKEIEMPIIDKYFFITKQLNITLITAEVLLQNYKKIPDLTKPTIPFVPVITTPRLPNLPVLSTVSLPSNVLASATALPTIPAPAVPAPRVSVPPIPTPVPTAPVPRIPQNVLQASLPAVATTPAAQPPRPPISVATTALPANLTVNIVPTTPSLAQTPQAPRAAIPVVSSAPALSPLVAQAATVNLALPASPTLPSQATPVITTPVAPRLPAVVASPPPPAIPVASRTPVPPPPAPPPTPSIFNKNIPGTFNDLVKTNTGAVIKEPKPSESKVSDKIRKTFKP